jgi:hypothetical protein
MSPLFMLFAWVCARAKRSIASLVTLFALVALTSGALFVYYTEPFGEQWREAVAHMRREYRSDDLVVISPGHYCIPFAYYFSNDFPENAEALEAQPGVVLENGSYRGLSVVDQAGNTRVDDAALASAQRIWLVSGYAPVDPVVLTWMEQGLVPRDTGTYVGARVRLLDRRPGPVVGSASVGK